MKDIVRRWILPCLALVLPAAARPVSFQLELWKEAPASYALETSSYRDGKLVSKKRRTVQTTIEEKSGRTIVSFRPSRRQVVEAGSPALAQLNEFEAFVDEFLSAHPPAMTFGKDHSVTLNLQKNLGEVPRFHKRYVRQISADSALRTARPDNLKAMVYVNGQILMGLFINPMVFSTEFEEGRFTYHFPETEPIREAVFDLRSTLYGYALEGEAFARDGEGNPVSRNTYRFDFSQELDVLERVVMEVQLLGSDARDVFVLTR